MRYLKNPLAITVIAAGIAVLVAAITVGDTNPALAWALVGAWVVVAALSVVSIRKQTRNGRP